MNESEMVFEKKSSALDMLILRIADQLPDGWEIQVTFKPGGSFDVQLINDFWNEYTDYMTEHEGLVDSLNDALQYALTHKANEGCFGGS